MFLVGLIVVFSALPLAVLSYSDCSQPWFIWRNNSCHCSGRIGEIVFCSPDKQNVHEIKACYCMTEDRDNCTAVGLCPYTCEIEQTWHSNGTILNIKLCSEGWNRNGLLCSQCRDGHGPLVYSYSLQCVECSHSVVKESILYFLLSFLPLTVFCLTIITLRISVARPPMSTFVLVCQVMAAPQYLLRIFVPHGRSISTHYKYYFVSDSVHMRCWQLFSSLFGVWNLDFFRSIYPPMCLSPLMSTLQAKFMEYIVAIFPLVILIVMYFGMRKCNRGHFFFFCPCKPLVSCLARLRQRITVHTSPVDTFATFIILAINKVGYTSFIILQPVIIYYPTGLRSIGTYVDPSTKYFGQQHIPYALAAIVFSVVLIVIPLLLLFLYPLKLFQRFLNNLQWQCSTLHIFADLFQGCYKNGTNGTRDYRWFAGLHLLLRFIIIFIFDMSNYYKDISLFMIICVVMYISLLAVYQPYNKYWYLVVDVFLLFGLLLWCTSLTLVIMSSFNGSFMFAVHVLLLTLSSSIPFFCFVGFILHWVLTVKKLHVDR